MLKKLLAAVAVMALAAGLTVVTTSAADAATTVPDPHSGQCIVDVVHHPAVAEQSHQEFQYQQVVPGHAATQHQEWRFQTRVARPDNTVERKYVQGYDFVDGGSVAFRDQTGHSQTVSGHWVASSGWHQIPDSVINAYWGSGGINDNLLGGSEASPKGSVPLSVYGGPSVSVKYYADKETISGGYTDYGPWSDWSTTNPGASTATMNVDSRWVVDSPATLDQTVYYLPGGGQSTALSDANWTVDVPGSPWSKINQRTVVTQQAKDAWDENVYGACPSSPCVSTSSTWFTEDVAPTQDAAGIRFTGTGNSNPVDYYHQVSGNLEGVIGSSYTITAASGYHTALVYEINRTAGTSSYATISIEPYMNGWTPGQTGSFTVTSSTVAWTSKISSGLGSQSQPATIDQLSAIFPKNELLTQGLHLGSNYPTTSYTVVSDVTGCGAVSFGAYAGPTYTEPFCAPGVPGSGIVNIPSGVSGATYELQVASGAWSPVVQGASIPVAAGATVTVRVSGPGHPLSSYPSHTFATQTVADCTTAITPAKPGFSDALCTPDGPGRTGTGSYTIPALVTGVDHYEVAIGNGAYATKAPGTYQVTPALLGTVVSVKAVLAKGYKLDRGAKGSWSERITAPAVCPAYPTEPDVTQAECTGPGTHGQASIDIPAIQGVIYSVSINGHPEIDVPTGALKVNPGDSVWIVATPKLGYYLSPAPALVHKWHVTIDRATCLKDVTVVKADVTATPQVCTIGSDGQGVYTDGTIVIPSITGVKFTIDGADASAGAHPVKPGDHSVAAIALTGFQLVDYAGPWTITSAYAPICGELPTHPIVTPTVADPQPSCSATGTYTLGDDLGIADAVIWTANGSPISAGDHPIAAGSTVHVHAEANGPDYGFVFGQQQDWTVAFTQPATCGELKTLALTGPGGAPVILIGGGAAALISGLALLVVPLWLRRRRDV
jgi:hypothetical protein